MAPHPHTSSILDFTSSTGNAWFFMISKKLVHVDFCSKIEFCELNLQNPYPQHWNGKKILDNGTSHWIYQIWYNFRQTCLCNTSSSPFTSEFSVLRFAQHGLHIEHRKTFHLNNQKSIALHYWNLTENLKKSFFDRNSHKICISMDRVPFLNSFHIFLKSFQTYLKNSQFSSRKANLGRLLWQPKKLKMRISGKNGFEKISKV